MTVNPECIKCIGKAQAEYYATVIHDAATDEICNLCGRWDLTEENDHESVSVG